MKWQWLSRDSAFWAVVIIGAATGFITSHVNKFPWIPPDYQGLVEMVSFVTGIVGAKMSWSPAGLSDDGKAKQQMQDMGKSEPTQPPVLPPPAAALLLVLLLPAVASAQIGTEPLAWQPSHRSIAGDVSNWAVVGQGVASAWTSAKDWREGKHRTAYRSGCSIGLAMAIAVPLKHLVSEPRPDGSDNLSWPSGHSAATAALSGWNFTVGVPVAALTGVLKLNQNAHHPKDVLSGWAIGAGTQALCGVLIR